MHSVLTAAVLVAMVFAGCAASTDQSSSGSPAAPANLDVADPIPVGPEHDHRDPEQHRFARNATLVTMDDLQRFGLGQQGIVGAHVLDLCGDMLAVGVNAGETSDGQQGFHLYDVANKTFQYLSYYEAPTAVGGDRTIAFSQDCKTVFLGYEGGTRPGVAGVDVSDPMKPVERGFWADPEKFGSHTVSTGTIGGKQYVFSLALGVNILSYADGTFTLEGKYLTADQLAALDAVRLVGADGDTQAAQTYALRSVYGHDMTFFQDAVTNKPLLFVAYAYEGLKVVDLTVPSAPVTIARWMPPADTAHKHYTHSVEVARSPDGQLLIVVGAETFETENQGIASPVWILDGTAAVVAPPLTVDPTHLGTWRNPGGAPAGNLGRSAHFFRLENGFLYLSHYHGGIWAIDLRTLAAQSNPVAFGYIMPLAAHPIPVPDSCCIGFDLGAAPMVFDVEVQNGRVFGADIIQGVSVVDFKLPA
jgi:hypothetical protein